MRKIALILIILTVWSPPQGALAQLAPFSKDWIFLGCAMKGQSDCMIEALERGANINVRHPLHGNTALHWAVQLKEYRIMRILIEHGADVEATNNAGETPLLYAVKSPSYRYYALSILIEAEADPNVSSRDGVIPLNLVAFRGHAKAVEMLIDAGADVNAVSPRTGRTALYWGIQKGQCSDTVQLLLNAGAKVNVLGLLAHNNMIELLKTGQINL